jgi:hypothetical protein
MDTCPTIEWRWMFYGIMPETGSDSHTPAPLGILEKALDYVRGQRKGKKEHTTPGGFLWQTN